MDTFVTAKLGTAVVSVLENTVVMINVRLDKMNCGWETKMVYLCLPMIGSTESRRQRTRQVLKLL